MRAGQEERAVKVSAVTRDDLRGVFPVPPLARKRDARRSIDFPANDRLVRHMREAGMTRFLYGGNAFLYHVTLPEYDELVSWLAGFADELWAIPSLGPSFGRALDQALLLRRHRFPCAMVLPCSDPRDAAGLEAGLREIAESAGMPLILYLKAEASFGSDREQGLDAVARLVESKLCVGIKYAVVRDDPRQDAYLEGLLKRVERGVVISGIGERPAVVHLRDFGLPGFTTGSGCLAPGLSNQLHAACAAGDFARAEKLRALFVPLEDARDAWGPARVLHAALDLAGVVGTGAIPPFVTALGADRCQQLLPVARALHEREIELRLGQPVAAAR
jgi:dihydrodipicolinate synthase/N-acetylneuraminate lyase